MTILLFGHLDVVLWFSQSNGLVLGSLAGSRELNSNKSLLLLICESLLTFLNFFFRGLQPVLCVLTKFWRLCSHLFSRQCQLQVHLCTESPHWKAVFYHFFFHHLQYFPVAAVQLKRFSITNKTKPACTFLEIITVRSIKWNNIRKCLYEKQLLTGNTMCNLWPYQNFNSS